MKNKMLLPSIIILSILGISIYAQFGPPDGAAGDPVASAKLEAYKAEMDITMSGIERAVKQADRNNVQSLDEAIDKMNGTLNLLTETYNSRDEFKSSKELTDFINFQRKVMRTGTVIMSKIRIGQNIMGIESQKNILGHLYNSLDYSMEGWSELKTIFETESKMTIAERIELLNRSKKMVMAAQAEIDLALSEMTIYNDKIEIRNQTSEIPKLFKFELN